MAQNASAPSDTILVFDASGSMWGQIDGVNKIVIARDVVADLLDGLPANQRMGLMAYGHNRKGDCNDIEMLAPVGTDHSEIAESVRAINPKGMTPMMAAVEQAAEALKYTERAARVILVSDGEETCHVSNLCDVAQKLEDLGVDLTVHTVGFGLESAEAKNAREQLQCMAETTGGQFFTADNAQELTEALTTVAAAEPKPGPEPAPEPPAAEPETLPVTLRATDQEGGPVIEDGLIWTVRDGGTGEVPHQSDAAGTIEVALTAGIKDVHVERPADGAVAEGAFNPADGNRYTLPIVVAYAASITAPDTATAGSSIRVSWEGPDHKDDYISVDAADKKTGYRTYVKATRTEKSSPLELAMPPEPGAYESRYVQRDGHQVLASQPLTVTEQR